ncbi:MAG: multicopper oxidase domain-containing protein [Chthoniobacterales bacterium]
MKTTMESTEQTTAAPWVFVAAAGVRAAFGVVMAVDAYLKWQPAFAAHYVGYLENAARSQPGWMAPWFNFWLQIVPPHAGLFIGATRWIETLIATGLILGFARRLTYLAGAVFSLLIWATAGGFGGPYTAGATNLGPALVYALVFIALILFARLLGSTPYSLDYLIGRRFPLWGSLMEWAPKSVWQRTPPILAWPHQVAAIVAIALALVVALGTLGSAVNAAPPTPERAAAAVSPLSLTSTAPVARAAPALLPPLIGNGDTVAVTITASDANVEIASGVQYHAWTFNGTVPAPVIHVRQGQTVNVTFLNNGTMAHSIDFHAAQVDPATAFRSALPGGRVEFSFVASVPGCFIYHCSTAPVLLHIGNGMYGAIIVDPAEPLPPADVSYVLVQGEWYSQQESGKLMTGNYDKMLAVTPDEVVFNGIAFQYEDHPLTAKVGQRIRIYFVDAGPNLYSSFHIIGGMFDAVYPDSDVKHALKGVSTYTVGPGQGMVFDAIMPHPGDYVFVDHSMRNMAIGAHGVLHVTP